MVKENWKIHGETCGKKKKERKEKINVEGCIKNEGGDSFRCTRKGKVVKTRQLQFSV